MSKKKSIEIRVSAEEKDLILSRAVETGTNISDFIRQAALNGQAVSAEKIHEMIREINKVGVNINQLARKANEAGHTPGIYNEASSLISEFRAFLYQIMNQSEGSR